MGMGVLASQVESEARGFGCGSAPRGWEERWRGKSPTPGAAGVAEGQGV